MSESLKQIFTFPHPVNEYAARGVALQVIVLTIIIISTEFWPLLFLLTYEFLARVFTGPTLSIMGQISTRVLTPLVIKKTRTVPGLPKQFAQSIGLAFTTTALCLIFFGDLVFAAKLVLAILGVFAALESFLGFCAGCWTFSLLMRARIVPANVCERCTNITILSATEETDS